MALNNMCIFEGNTTKDFEVNVTPNGTTIAKTTLAVNSGRGENKETTYVRIKAFNETAKRLADNVGKGSSIQVNCKYKISSYDGQDGKKQYDHEFIINETRYGNLKAPGGVTEQQQGDRGQQGQGNSYYSQNNNNNGGTYGNQQFGNQHNNQPNGNQQFGNQQFGNQQFGNQQFGNQQYSGQQPTHQNGHQWGNQQHGGPGNEDLPF